ncbi:MAG: glycoside hydrolase family 19 protein [Sulfuriferula sp.]|nr:glycoside hydrolase family 19 protein [Sulfuriferula sp.]
MAKSTKFESGNDFDFDDNFGDIPDFAEPKEKGQNKRIPMLSLGKSALKGAVGDSGLTDESFLRRTIRSVLPSGYGSALDIADEASSTLRSLYNDSYKELRPLLNDMKRVTARMQEPLDKYLPKSISKRLDEWSKSIDQATAGGPSEEDQRDAMINASIAETLKHQVVQDAKREQRDDARGKIREQIDQIRHKDSVGQLNQIRLATAQLAAYQNNVTSQYHRKSLELQYRTLFTLRDIAIEQKRMSEVTTDAYTKIVKNTGLPDYVKLSDSDRLGQATRNRFGKLFDSGIVAARKEFVQQFGKQFKDVMMDRVRNFASGAGMALQGADSAADVYQMTQGMEGMGMEGMSPQELLAEMGGGMVAQHYGKKAVNAVRKRLPTTGPIAAYLKKGRRLGNKIGYNVGNLQTNAKNWGEGYDAMPGFLGKILPSFLQEMIRDAVNRVPGYDRNLQKDRLQDMQGPAIWSRQSAKTLNEVIPGYLARILREQQMLRTGSDNIELLRFDYSAGKFAKTSELKKRTYDQVISKSNSQGLNQDVEKLLQEIDPQGKLSKEARSELRKQLVRDTVRNQAGVAERYMDSTHVSPEIADHFQSRYGAKADPEGDAKNRYSNQHRALGGNVSLARSMMQDQVNAGLAGMLEDMGLLDQHGNMALEKIFDYHLDYQEMPDSSKVMPGAKGGLRRASRKRGEQLGRGAGGQRGAGIRHTNITNNHAPAVVQPHTFEQTPQTQNFTAVIDAIKANNNLTLMEKVSETLIRIEKEIQAGVVMYNAGNLEASRLGPDGKPFLDRSLRQHWHHAKDSASSFGKKALDWWNEPGYGTQLWNNKGKIWADTKKKVGDFWQGAKDKYSDMKEVYIDGELTPRLTAWGLKAGMYYDSADVATRKAIKKISDIKGPVFDAAGVEIINATDAAKMFVRTTANKWIRVTGTWIKDNAKKLWGAATGGYKAAIDYGKELFKKGQAYVDAQDVYSKSDTKNPKLRASIMRARGYRSKAHPEKVILSPADIDGPVLDLEGNTPLTADDIAAGLVDAHGRELVSGKLRLIQLGHDTVHMAFQKVKNGFNMAKDFLSGKWQGFANWFKIDGIAFSGGKTIIERLTEIRDLLEERLPNRKKKVLGDVDGDGIREGSYEDEKKKGKLHEAVGTSAEEAVKTAKDMAERMGKKGQSLYGAVGGAAMGLFNRFKNRKKKGEGEEGEGEAGKSTLDKVIDYGGDAATLLSLIPGGKLARKGWGAAKGAFGLGKKGLQAGAEALKAAEIGRKTGTGFVAAREALKASKGMKLAEEAEEIMHAAQAAGLSAQEAEALAADAVKGGKAAEKIGLGKSVRKGLLSGLKGGFGMAKKGLGAAYEMNQAGNLKTGKLAGQGLRLAGRGLWEGGKLAGKGILGIGKFGAKTALPWAAKDVAKNAMKLGRGGMGLMKMGGGLGLGIGLDVASHYANATGHETIGKGLDYAGDAVTGWGLASTVAGMAGIEGGALGLGGAILGAVGAPVLLGAAALAGGAYAGYKLYKWSKTKNLTDLSKMRYIQYGFAENDDDHWKAVFALEDLLEDRVKASANGKPYIDAKGLKEDDLLEPFDIDKKNKDQLQNWLKWFTLRFKPVFMVNMSALRKVDEKLSLKKVEDLKPNQKKTFITIASWPGGPYKYDTSPFASLDKLPSGDAEVTAYVATITKKVDEQVKKQPESEKAATAAKVGDAAPKTIKEIQAAATVAQGIGAPQGPAPNWQGVADDKGKMGNMGIGASGAMLTMKGTFDATSMGAGDRLDGITSIRLKAYGLTSMDVEKVKALLALENITQKDVKLDSKNVATWSGDMAKLFGAGAPQFGVTIPNTTLGMNWISWYRNRFLPVYLNYLTALSKATNQKDPRSAMTMLKPQDALDVATAIKAASGQAGSVWGVKQMPWPQYEANTDSASTDANFAALKDKAQIQKMAETVSVTKDDKQTWLGKKWQELTTDAQGNKNWLGKASDTVSKAFNFVKDGVAKTTEAAIDAGQYGAVNSKPITADAKKLKAAVMAGLKQAGITSPAEIAMFLAQMDVESGGFTTLSENLNYSPSRLYSVFPKYFNSASDAQQVAAGGAKAIANRVYGKRMGNVGPDDGYNYRGRGIIQLTGKANYEKYGKMIGVDLVNKPDLAADPDTAVKIAIAYWKDHKASGPAQQGDVRTVTEAINGGTNGLADRAAKFKQYLSQANNGQLAAQAGGDELVKGGAGAPTIGAAGTAAAAPAGNRGTVGGVAAGATSTAAPTTTAAGTPTVGAPMGFGGSSPTPAADGSAPTPAKTVFDNMGGAGKPAAPAAPAPSQTSTRTPAKASDPFAMPALPPSAAQGTGFPTSPTRAADQVATQRAQAASQAATAVPDGGLAAQSLSVQKDMLVALQTLVKYAGQGGQPGGRGAMPVASGVNDPSSMQTTVAGRKAASSQTGAMPRPMISMDKPSFA